MSGGGGGLGGGGKKWLPFTVQPLGETASLLRDPGSGKEVLLIGTAHISDKSADEVRAAVRRFKPDAVLVELCKARAEKMRLRTHGGKSGGASSDRDGSGTNTNSPRSSSSSSASSSSSSASSFSSSSSSSSSSSTFSEGTLGMLADAMSTLAKEFGGGGGGLRALPGTLLGLAIKLQYRLLEGVGATPGGEFRAAMEEAETIGARLVYMDREQTATLSRLRESLTFGDLFKLWQLHEAMSGKGEGVDESMRRAAEALRGNVDLKEAVEKMKSRAYVRAQRHAVASVYPKLVTALVDERDDVMARAIAECPGHRLVAVVGLGHMDGIEHRLAKPPP